MKFACILIVLVLSLVGCEVNDDREKVEYRIVPIYHVPDSLKEAHRNFIIEATRAASQHMSAGDYEDVDETIEQAEITADRLFQVKAYGLEREFPQGNGYFSEDILPKDFTPHEKRIFDSLYARDSLYVR